MRFTPEMIAEDEKQWHARNVDVELEYCGHYMKSRKDMTNLDIRFYAYIMRKAAVMIKKFMEDQEPVEPMFVDGEYVCGKCGTSLEMQRLIGSLADEHELSNYCAYCGKKVKQA